MTHFGTTRLTKCLQNPEKCHLSPAPTLAKAKKEYGPQQVNLWLQGNIIRIAEYAGVREKMNSEQINLCAELILATYYFLNLDEMLCFFGQFMVSGKFYGQVDPMALTKALDGYCNERAVRLAKIESQRKLAEREKELARTDTCTYEEYLAMKERGEI